MYVHAVIVFLCIFVAYIYDVEVLSCVHGCEHVFAGFIDTRLNVFK